MAACKILTFWRTYRQFRYNKKANNYQKHDEQQEQQPMIRENIIQKVVKRRNSLFSKMNNNSNQSLPRKSFQLSIGSLSNSSSLNNSTNAFKLSQDCLNASSSNFDEEEEEIVCIIEKCYVMIGTKPESHSLAFIALQKLVDLERKVS